MSISQITNFPEQTLEVNLPWTTPNQIPRNPCTIFSSYIFSVLFWFIYNNDMIYGYSEKLNEEESLIIKILSYFSEKIYDIFLIIWKQMKKKSVFNMSRFLLCWKSTLLFFQMEFFFFLIFNMIYETTMNTVIDGKHTWLELLIGGF